MDRNPVNSRENLWRSRRDRVGGRISINDSLQTLGAVPAKYRYPLLKALSVSTHYPRLESRARDRAEIPLEWQHQPSIVLVINGAVPCALSVRS